MDIVETVEKWTEAAIEAVFLMEERSPQVRPLNEPVVIDKDYKPARTDPFPRLRETPGEPLPEDFSLSGNIVRYCDSGRCSVGPDPIIEFSDAVRRFYGQRTHYLVSISQPELTRERLLIMLELALQAATRIQEAALAGEEGSLSKNVRDRLKINARMNFKVAEDGAKGSKWEDSCTYWTLRQWAEHLGCSKEAVRQTSMWKVLENDRARRGEARKQGRRGGNADTQHEEDD